MVSAAPMNITYQLILATILFVYIGVIPPKTNATKVNCDKLKKYPASFSRLTLSFSFVSCAFCCTSLDFTIRQS